jgi:hypothetical protein
MSDLRKQLESACREYDSARYPGDLGDELLAPSRGNDGNHRITPQEWRIRATVAALAAAIMIVVWLFPMMRSSRTAELAQSTEQTVEQGEQEAAVQLSLDDARRGLSMPSLSSPAEQIDFTPASPDFSFSSPSITLIDYESQQDQEQQTSTTQESA